MKKTKSELINMTEISRRLTGNPHSIRANAVPRKWKNTIHECKKCMDSILSKAKLNEAQKRQKSKMKI